MIGPVSPIAAGVLGALLGLLVGAVVVAQLLHDRRRELPAPKVVPDDLDAVVQSLASAAVLVGPNDEIVAHNQAALAGGVVRGTRIGIPVLLDLIRTSRVDRLPVSVDLEQTRGQGRPPVQLAVHVTPLSDRITFVSAEDRADSRRAQESARDFMANATHELKTPVGAITLLAEAAEQAADDPESATRFARKIQAEASRLAQLVNQIILLSRLQGDVPSDVGEVDVDEVVTYVLEHSRRLAEQRQITLTTGGVTGLSVTGDRGQVVTAVTNLVHNAITYSDPKARVVVTTRAEHRPHADLVAIAVSDNGIGIAEEDRLRIFERFYRVDYARSRATGGTGLGLSIVAEIAQGHGGDVTVWSKPGSGSTFTLTLPAGPSRANEEEPS